MKTINDMSFRRSFQNLCISTILFFSVYTSTSLAVLVPEDSFTEVDAGTMRANIYFANIPTFEAPCEPIKLLYDKDLLIAKSSESLLSITADKRVGIQEIRMKGGLYEQALREREAARKAFSQAYLDRLTAAFDYYVLERDFKIQSAQVDAPSLKETGAHKDQLTMAYLKLEANWYSYILQLYHYYQSNSAVQELVDNYYTMVEPAFDGLSIEKQRSFLGEIEKSLGCLRDYRVATFNKYMKSTLVLESSFKPEDGSEPTKTDVINLQIKRSALRVQYWAAGPEFGRVASVYRKLLWSHDKKLRNGVLKPLLDKAQQKHPTIGPHQAFPKDPERTKAREQVAQNLAKIGYVTLLEDEFILEGTYTINVSPFERMGSVLKDIIAKKDSSVDIWKWVYTNAVEDITQREALMERVNKDGFDADALLATMTDQLPDKTNIDTIFMQAALIKQVLGNALDQVIMTPLTDKGIALTHTYVGNSGLKTSTENNYEAYKTAIQSFAPRIELMEHWSSSLTTDTVEKFNSYLRSSSTSSTSYSVAEGLLRNHDFTAKIGIIKILEELCEDPADHRALWLNAVPIHFQSRLATSRNRLAATRGMEPLTNPDKALTTADLNMGVFGHIYDFSDWYLKIPSLVKNFFGQYLGEYASQEQYLKSLLPCQRLLKEILAIYQEPEVEYDYGKLKLHHAWIYDHHIALMRHCVDYAEAIDRIKLAETDRGNRYIAYASPMASQAGSPELSGIGQIILTSAMQWNKREALVRSKQIAYSKLEYFAHTANYRAADKQIKEWAKIANSLLKEDGIQNQEHDVSRIALEFRAKAIASETVSVYEATLNEAIASMVTGFISSRATEYLLKDSIFADEKLFNKWKADVIKKKQGLPKKLLGTMLPGYDAIFEQGFWGLVENVSEDMLKGIISQAIAHEVNQRGGHKMGTANAFESDDFLGIVGHVYDTSKDITEYAFPAINKWAIKKSPAWYATDAKIDMYKEAATDAKEILDAEIDQVKVQLQKALNELEADNKPKNDLEQSLDLLEKAFNEGLVAVPVIQARDKYRRAHEELDTAREEREQIYSTIRNYLVNLSMFNSLTKSAENLLSSKKTDSALLSSAQQTLGEAETWKRILFNRHSLEDLESILTPANKHANPHTLQQIALTRRMDINMLRNALNSSLHNASSDTEKKKIRDVAKMIDGHREKIMEKMLKDYIKDSKYAGEISAIVQGGAAVGNPEHQGLFGDFDFTLVQSKESKIAGDVIKADIVKFFSDKGYPLAEENTASSLDSEAFVQKQGIMDPNSSPAMIAADMLEKGEDATRFQAHGSAVWFNNSTAYSGRLLWSKDGAHPMTWQKADRSDGFGFATDMIPFLSFLGASKYHSSNIDTLSTEAEKRKVLGKALSKGKVFLRLIDALIISDAKGNKVYNENGAKKAAQKNKTGLDASYHWQIYENAKNVQSQRKNPSDKRHILRTKEDFDMVRRLAEMKLKETNPDPWSVLSNSDEAKQTMDWMIEKAPRILARLAHQNHERSVLTARFGTKEEKQKLLSDTMRISMVYRSFMHIHPEATFLLAPKMKDGKVLSEDDHATRYAKSITSARLGEHPAQGINKKLHALDNDDRYKSKTRKEMATYLANENTKLNADIPTEKLTQLNYEAQFEDTYKYFRHILNL